MTHPSKFDRKKVSKFRSYVAPTSGTSKCTEQEIVNFSLNADGKLTDPLIAPGCTGTYVNVGINCGIKRMPKKDWINPYSGLFVIAFE